MDPASPSGPENPALRDTLSYEDSAREARPSSPTGLARGAAVHRYIVLERVGEGGMGVVYAAYDPSLDRRVALKFLNLRVVERDDVREKRLLREAQAMARLSHPNVAVVYEVGTFHGHVFLAMEFVDGVDLRAWLAARPRSVVEILELFCAAGRGLAAAHAAGVVHRDFKPENVLVDSQGRPRVTDFGLSRAVQERLETAPEPELSARREADPHASAVHLSTPLTRTGGVLGTPSYMAPEQHGGGAVDARSDQFSFCVALHEAIHGQLPGAPRAAPASRLSVPRWCRQALTRGLARAPQDRFPSMDELLAALSAHLLRKRRQVVIAASLAVAVAGAGAYALLVDRPAAGPAPRCDLGARRLAGVWDQPRKQQLSDAFRRSGARSADVTWNAFSAIVDGRAGAWVAMHDQACRATHFDGVQSAAVLDLRMECLERRREEMAALLDVYADRPDASAMDRAVNAADKLSSVSACSDVGNLRAVVPLPEDPATRARVQSVRQRLRRSRALYDAGKYREGSEYMAGLKREADALGYAPLAAEAAEAYATHLSHVRPDEAQSVLLEATRQAVKGRDWKLEAELWLTLVKNYGRLGRVRETLLAAHAAELAVERANGDDRLRASLARSTAFAEYNDGNSKEALRQYQLSLALSTRSSRGPSPFQAAVLGNIGQMLVDLGRNREGLEYLSRAMALQRTMLRADHPDIAFTLAAMAIAHNQLGSLKAARQAAETAVAIRTQELGPENPLTTGMLHIIGELEAKLGNIDEALAVHARQLSIEKRVRDPNDIYLATTYVAMGATQRRAGLDDQAQRTLHEAIAQGARAGSPDGPDTGYALVNLGAIHNRHGRHAEALRSCRRAAEILSAELGHDSGQLLEARECVAEGLIGTGRPELARKELERALGPVGDREVGPQRLAGARLQLARALWQSPGDRQRARALAQATLGGLAAAEGDNRQLMSRIRSWLSTHAEPRSR